MQTWRNITTGLLVYRPWPDDDEGSVVWLRTLNQEYQYKCLKSVFQEKYILEGEVGPPNVGSVDSCKALIIGFGGHMGHGKSTAAEFAEAILSENQHLPVVRMAFAAEVKRIATECFGWDGKKDARGRRLLQVIGTEAGRDYNPNIWVEHFDEIINSYVEPCIVLIDDVRFPNECDYINERGMTYRVFRREAAFQVNPGAQAGVHRSEAEMGNCDWTGQINNEGDLDSFKRIIEETLTSDGWIGNDDA